MSRGTTFGRTLVFFQNLGPISRYIRDFELPINQKIYFELFLSLKLNNTLILTALVYYSY